MFLAAAAVLATLLVTAAPFAASTRRDLVVRDEVVVDGQPIPAGNYALKWKENGANGQYDVTVHRGTKVVVQASGRTIQLDQPSDNDSLVYQKGEDGSSNLVEIRFAGSKTAIEVSQSAVARAKVKN
jgi:hypothetical protein